MKKYLKKRSIDYDSSIPLNKSINIVEYDKEEH